MKTKLIHITSGKGPAECCLVVALALKEMICEAKEAGLEHEVISRTPGETNKTLQSATLKLEGKDAEAFLTFWAGVLLWISQSPYRKFHKRKNWFIGVNEISSSVLRKLDESELSFQTMSSSGPGGQNVNKTETAVKAIHKASGLCASCDSYRSQLQNKHEAIRRVNGKYDLWQQTKLTEEGHGDTYENNTNRSRGNPKKIYRGEHFRKESR